MDRNGGIVGCYTSTFVATCKVLSLLCTSHIFKAVVQMLSLLLYPVIKFFTDVSEERRNRPILRGVKPLHLPVIMPYLRRVSFMKRAISVGLAFN